MFKYDIVKIGVNYLVRRRFLGRYFARYWDRWGLLQGLWATLDDPNFQHRLLQNDSDNYSLFRAEDKYANVIGYRKLMQWTKAKDNAVKLERMIEPYP